MHAMNLRLALLTVVTFGAVRLLAQNLDEEVRLTFPALLASQAEDHRLVDGAAAPRVVAYTRSGQSGEAATLLFVAYSDYTSGAVRLLHQTGAGLEVAADYSRLLRACCGGTPNVETHDIDGDRRVEYFAIFPDHRGIEHTYVFARRGDSLVMLNPAADCSDDDGPEASTALLSVGIVDLNGDGVMELFDSLTVERGSLEDGTDEGRQVTRIWGLSGDRYAKVGEAVFVEPFTRRKGAPRTKSESFQAKPGAATIRIANGAAGRPLSRVTSAEVRLNGQLVLGPDHLNPSVTAVDVPVLLSAENQISVRVAGQPDTFILVCIVASEDELEPCT